MKKYKYTAYDKMRRRVEGVMNAVDETHLKSELRKKELYLVNCRVIDSVASASTAFKRGRMKRDEFSFFCRQFSIMLQASVPISECLDTLCDLQCSKALKKALLQVNSDVRAGIGLCEAFEKHPNIFPEYFIGMVRTGVEGGRLPETLEDAAFYYEKEQKHRKKISHAISYPILVFSLIVILIALLVLFVVPIFENTFNEMGISDPPVITRVLFDVCRFLKTNALFIAVCVFLLAVLIYVFFTSKKTGYYRDVFILKLPMIGNLYSSVIALRFSRGMGVLLKSGVDILEAFDIVASLTCSRYAERVLHTAAMSLERGKSVYDVLNETHLFPVMLLQMVRVGEKSSDIDGALLKSCDFLDGEIEGKIDRAVEFLQPIAIIAAGLFVALIFLAVYIPIIGIMNGI